MDIGFIGQLASEAAKAAPHTGDSTIDLVAKVIIPILVVLIPLMWKSMSNSVNKATSAAEAAAASVQPNGSGHKSVVHMLEDVLKEQGVQIAMFKTQDAKLDELKKEFEGHMREPGHAAGLNMLQDTRDSLKELISLVNMSIGLKGSGSPE
jgi:hypothetical protein